jgi:hypothetical protein
MSLRFTWLEVDLVARDKTIRTKGKETALVDPKVQDRLQAAATAAGFDTIAALADLLVDSGAVALPPDGVGEVYTLEDLGVQMRTQMPVRAERPDWFRGLVETQRIALVAVLRTRGYSTATIAIDFGIDPISVNKIYARYSDELGAQVVNVRLNTLVGSMQLAGERAAEGAMNKEDWGTYWRITKETIALLQSLGIVKKAIQKVEVAHTFDDQKSAELEALLKVERQQAARQEELKLADVTITDEVPQIDLPKAPGTMEEPYEDAD